MNYYVISLERTPERLEQFQEINTNFEFEKFDAIDGQTLNATKLLKEKIITQDIANRYTKGALGVAMSHRALWGKCVELNEPITVLEDDAIINKNFKQIVERTTPIDDGWDFIFWGSNLDQNIELSILPGIMFSQIKTSLNLDLIKGSRQYDIAPTFYRCKFAVGLVGYSITPKCAKYLLDVCFPLSDPYHKKYLNFGIDHSVMDELPYINAYYCFPPLVMTTNDQTTSTVQK